MSIPPEPQLSLAHGQEDEMAARREQAASRPEGPEGEVVRQEDHEELQPGHGPGPGHEPTPSHDHGEVIAAALVRVTTMTPPGALVPGGWPGARIGVALQTVSAVDWLSAGRARGAA